MREAPDRSQALQRAASKLANRLEEVEPEGKGRGPGAGGSRGNESGADEARVGSRSLYGEAILVNVYRGTGRGR